MITSRITLFGTIFTSVALSTALGDESNNLPKDLFRFHSDGAISGVFDGGLYFSGSAGRPAEKNERKITVDSYLFQHQDGTPSVFIPPNERGKNEAHDAQNWKYLTADYSTNPPSVTLTKSAGKYSKWAVEYIKIRPSGESAYVRNVNDLDKDAWLYWEQDGPVGSAGLSRFKLLKPILSFEKKVIYNNPKVRRPDGK